MERIVKQILQIKIYIPAFNEDFGMGGSIWHKAKVYYEGEYTADDIIKEKIAEAEADLRIIKKTCWTDYDLKVEVRTCWETVEIISCDCPNKDIDTI